ncbi:MAG: outer membrane lipoprotein chaperone LolA [Gammaproteobacteria bacterium]|jgi:outer membrane lipoprotein carrier protein|nr:outer membrane lipoprotein chaperone LolA [Gammaproteobacteria bacterium]MBU2178460.1 outer membrane lipoprotein chaperone LolA [Gammaproteobacteria bacterium]MBU2224900.1 outer membrane lipoprotein chaperone LolA [Gammaproteobacteria bacterium]MBU2279641.1 outer membrane lipoprotein chaperone LolA [Gammaproteobacteria bacterium]MBU2428973.1 outer membrane lipoprotein chaperone LolA [Gammaproteobacteria bacterium]
MKKLVVVLSLLLSGGVHAAAEQADALKNKLARLYSYQASFVQTVVDAKNQPVQEAGEGMLTLKQPSLFRFETLSPEPNLFIGDGKTLWHYNELLEQVSLYDAKKEVNQTPFVLLTSNDASLWQQYDVSGEGQQYIITPKNKDNPVRQLTLTFAGVGLSHMAVLDNNGQRSDFEFLAIQNNVELEANLFKFVTPEGVDVEDLRNK